MKHLKYSICPVQTRVVIVMFLMGLAAAAYAQGPDPELSHAISANSQPVSVFMLPNGYDLPLTEAQLYGGMPTDATITLTLMNADGNPVSGYPAAQCYLMVGASGDWLPICANGTIADWNTNGQGQTTFTNPLKSGGSDEPVTIMIGTWPTPEFPVDFPQGDLFQFNSPDINGDLYVNLSDVQMFVSDFYGEYNYRCDFFWDGMISLPDIALLAQGIGASCP
jgi:hypothetical protein